MYPDLFTIPSFNLFGWQTPTFTLHTFGLMAMLGFLIPTLLMRREFARNRMDPEMSSNISVAAIIGGFIGARLYYIIEHFNEFLKAPSSFIFSGAGLVWYGGFFGGALAVLWLIHHYRAPLWKTVDIVAPQLLLGQAFGRMGCLLAADGDYGPPSDLPWAMAFPNGVVPTAERVHPTPLYEIFLLLAFFAILWKLRKRSFPAGTMFGMYFIAAGIGRFATEFWRTTPKIAFGWMSLAQIISIAMILVGILIIQARKQRSEPSEVKSKKVPKITANE
jgi:phosphatidylglycerol:prolipoprotein diacylglycerol transferase